MLAGKNVLLGVTGGIAVYKAVDLASKLIKEKANVKVIMTGSATEFVSPLTFRSITRQAVVTNLFDAEAPVEHISLADWCDIAVIAPATANIIGKIASGIADDLLSTSIMATTSPKVIVPAMNVHMWENPLVQENIIKLEQHGYFMVPPDKGRLACGYEGEGRFPDPQEIVFFIKSYLHHAQDLTDKTVLITAGACREFIDPMRYMSNLSSGKMGLALARAAYHRGAEIILVYSHIQGKIPYFIKNKFSSLTSEEMHKNTIDNYAKADILIMNAAVTDFKPAHTSQQKIKKEAASGNNNHTLELKKTTDILKEVYRQKKEHQVIMGFAAETGNLIVNARKKLSKCDYAAVNNIDVAGKDNTSITILGKSGEEVAVSGSKFEAAHKILDFISGVGK